MSSTETDLKNHKKATTTVNKFGQSIGFEVPGWITRKKPVKEKMIGNYCILEPLEIDKHGLHLFNAFMNNNPGETWTYLAFGPFDTYEAFKTWLNEACLNRMYFVIIDNHTKIASGLASYLAIEAENGSIEVGSIHYSKSLQKTPAATEAMYLMMYHVFEELGYRRYQWRCNSLNHNSRAAAERLGFKFEGIIRQSNVHKNHNRDTALYSIIDSEWPGLKEKFQAWLDYRNFDKNGRQLYKLQDITKLKNNENNINKETIASPSLRFSKL